MDRRKLISILSIIAVLAILILIVLAIRGDLGQKPPANQPQIVSFTVNTTTVNEGQTVILSYLVLGATKLTIDNNIGQLTNSEAGSVYSLPLVEASTYVFTLSAYGTDPTQKPVTAKTDNVIVSPLGPLPPQIENVVITSEPVSAATVSSLFNVPDSNSPYAYLSLDNEAFYINFKCDISNDPTAYFVLSYSNSQGVSTSQTNAQPLVAGATTEFYFPVPSQGPGDRVFTITASGKGGSSAAQIPVFVNKYIGTQTTFGTISASSENSNANVLEPGAVPLNGSIFIDWQAPGSKYMLFQMNIDPQIPFPNYFLSNNRYLFASGSNMLVAFYTPQALEFTLLNSGGTNSLTLEAGAPSSLE